MRDLIARARGRRSHRRACRRAVAPIAILAALALGAAPASAEFVHVPTETISGFTNNPFTQPRAVAVDNSGGPNAGDVYVADNGNRRVVQFSPTGEFLTSWGKEVNEGTGDPNICTNFGAPSNICKPGVFSSAPYGIGNSFSIVVDSSPGPSAGDIYVNSGSRIQKFDPTGHLVTSFGGTPFPGAIQTSGFGSPDLFVDSSGVLHALVGTTVYKFDEDGNPLGSITTPFNTSTGGNGGGFALEPSGDFFEVRNINFSNQPIEKISSTGEDLGQVSTGAFQNRGLAFDPGTNELLAAYQQYPLSAVRVYRFNGSGEVIEPGGGTCPLNPSGCEPSEEFANEGELNSFNGGATGVGLNTANHKLYVDDTYNNMIRTYSLINVPKLTTSGTENLTRTSVKFLGQVDPDGAGEVTTCRFEYGTTTEYELGSVPCQPATTTTAMNVDAELPLNTLTAQTQYHYRLVAGNANGERPGADQTFTTLDAVFGVGTEPATDVERITTTFNGAYTGDAVDTSYYFEFGPTDEYGQKTAVVDDGAQTGPQAIAMNVTGLYSYYLYHYRFVATNQYGTSTGEDQTFHTLAPDMPSVVNTYASTVNADSAVINAEIDPGEGLTVYRFEYGPSAEYGSKTLVEGPIDPNEPARTASSEITGLAPGTTYHFRVRVTNFTGTAVGPDEQFTTPSPPTIVAATAAAVGRTTATLSATINPGLSATTYHFDYGTGAGYGASTPESAPIGPDDAMHGVSAEITGLTPGTTYHFRAVATNPVGLTEGVDATFTTEAEATKQVMPADCSGFGSRAKKFAKKAKRLRREAKRAHGKRARVLRRKARGAAKQAGRLGKKARACRSTSGGSDQ